MTTVEEDQEQMDYLRGYRDGKRAASRKNDLIDLAGIFAGMVAGYLIGAWP